MDTLDVDKASLLPPERITHDLQGDAERQMDLRTLASGEALSHQAITSGGAGSMETFTHGKVTLLHADCMAYLRSQPDNSFELAVCDPPYGIGVAKSGNVGGEKLAKVTNYAAKEWDAYSPDSEYFLELQRVSVNQILWGANHFMDKVSRGSPCWIVWDKENSGNFADCELAFTSFETAVRIFKYRWNGMLQGDMKNKEQRIHPTQKPVKLYEWLLTNYAKTGQRILDTHLGSGSSAIAVHNLGFEFVGMELDADYYQAAVKRFKAHAAQESLFGTVYDQVEREEYSQGDLL